MTVRRGKLGNGRGPAVLFLFSLLGACTIDEGGLQVVDAAITYDTGAGDAGQVNDAAVDQWSSSDLPATIEHPVFDAGDLPSDADTDDAGADAWGDATPEVTPPACQHCSGYSAPRSLGQIPSVVKELSGLAASRVHPGIVYAHNDSGDTARFFALDLTAKLNAELDLPGATNVDWEDMAMGPCPAGSCVYIGDIGDNDLNRKEYAIYRVAEPANMPTGGGTITVTYERFPFVYPDGTHNAESLLIHPTTGRVFIILKEATAAPVYELTQPLQADRVATVVKVATMSVSADAGLLTAGAFHPCGDRILVRSKVKMFELTRPAGGDLLSVFGATPVEVPLAVEPQGEAVEYSPDGLGYFTSSETNNGITPELSYVQCQ